jgi:hypothetical protein
MQLRQELRLLVKGGKAANPARDALAQRRSVPAVVLSRWSGGEPNLRFWIFSVKEMQSMWQFGWVYRYQSISNSLSQNRFRFGIFWEPRDCPRPIIL